MHNMFKRIWNNKLFLILLLASFLRLFLLARVPPSLNWDEISMGYTAHSLGTTGMDEWGDKLPIFFRSYGEWKSAVYIYLTIPFVQIFGLNAWGVRLPSALFGILAVYLTYLLGRDLYGKKVGLWSSLFMAVTPWHLMLSRPAFEANVSLTLILGGLYFFFKLLRSNSHLSVRYILYSAVLFGLAPHTYNSAKIVVPILVLFLLFKYRKDLKSRTILYYLGVLALFAAPIIFTFTSGISAHRFSQVGLLSDWNSLSNFLSYRSSSPFPEFFTKLILNRYTYFAYSFIHNYLRNFYPAFYLPLGGTHNQYHLPYHGVLYWSEFAAMLVGLFALISAKGKYSRLPLTLILLGFIPAAATVGTHHVLRSILTLPGWQLLAGIGLVHLEENNFKYLKLGLIILALEVVFFTSLYFLWYPRAHARDWQYGHKEAIDYVESVKDQYDHVVFTKWYGEPQLFIAFYSHMDPKEFMEENKKLLVYEDSPDKLWVDQLEEYSIGKYTFKYIDWVNEKKDGKTLFVGKPDDFWPDSNVVKKINYPDGTPAFYIVAD